MKNLKYVIMLIALMMVSSAFAKAETKNSSCIETVVSDWTGTWDTSFGQVILNQKNQYVVGTYRELGAIRSLTTMGTAFYGEFDNNGRVGYFKWIKSGNSFTGTWGLDSKPRTRRLDRNKNYRCCPKLHQRKMDYDIW
nr:hypothetical protein [Nonlabens ulvanivorans]